MVDGGHRETSSPLACCLLMTVLLLCVAGSLATILQTGEFARSATRPAGQGGCGRFTPLAGARSQVCVVMDAGAHSCRFPHQGRQSAGTVRKRVRLMRYVSVVSVSFEPERGMFYLGKLTLVPSNDALSVRFVVLTRGIEPLHRPMAGTRHSNSLLG